jgi:hypothetical protein
MIIGRWLTPLNSSRTMRGVPRRDDNSRKKVQNVRGDSSAESHTCWETGELEAITRARGAVDAGGVAFLLIDADLIKDDDGETEEDMWWRSAPHEARQQIPGFGAWRHCMDDNFPPNHWAVYLGDLTFSSGNISMRLWSWGREYELKENADSFTENLYWVITGEP